MNRHDDARIRDGALLFLTCMESLRICEKVQDRSSIRGDPDAEAAQKVAQSIGPLLLKALKDLGLDSPTDTSYVGLLPIGLRVCEMVAELDHVGIVMES